MTPAEIPSVSQLNSYIKLKIDGDQKLSSVFVKGEISNFTNHYRTGHFYFSLKDEKSLIRAVMFSFNAGKIKFAPENGMKVIAHGRVAVFERDGQYQLYVDEMQPDGIGALYVAFNQLKEKLEKEGLFDPRHKKPLPKIPLRVGVITSPTGAAVRDIINVMERRFPLAGIYIYPALVQGDGAAAQLIDAIKFFNREKKADVLILGRGGGSIEDLWAFNDEGLARAIYDSEIPVISAVGHETDFTIADFAADMRAPTPSAAAELCVPDSTALTHSFENLKQRIFLLTYNELKQKKKLVDMLKNSRVLTSPTQYLDERRMSLIYFSKSLENSAMTILMKKRHSLSCLGAKMDSLSPLAVLSRGYSFAEGSHGILKTVSDVERGDSISVRLSDGRVSASVTDIIFDEKQGESFHGE